MNEHGSKLRRDRDKWVHPGRLEFRTKMNTKNIAVTFRTAYSSALCTFCQIFSKL